MYESFVDAQNELYHHGIRGQRWGIRRFQNKDGSLKAAGKARYDDKNTKSKSNAKKPGSTKTSAYEKNLTDGKKLLQDMVLGPAGSVTYRMARGVGEGRVKAALRSVFDINLSQIAGVSVGNAAGNIVTNLIGPDSISGQTLGQTAGIAANYSVQEATKDSGLSLQQRALRKKMNGR